MGKAPKQHSTSWLCVFEDRKRSRQTNYDGKTHTGKSACAT